jgi:SOS-response transcriptional repressor LexA
MAKIPSGPGIPRFARAIRVRRTYLGLSQEALALRTQVGREADAKDAVSQRTVSALETGKQDPGDLSAVRLSNLIAALEWTPHKFERETGVKLPGFTKGEVEYLPDAIGDRRIPVFDMNGAGPGGIDGQIVEYIDIPSDWEGQYAGYLIEGDSMPHSAPNGSIVIVSVNDRPSEGDIVVAWTEEEGMVCKRFSSVHKVPGTDMQVYVLTSENPDVPAITTTAIHFKGYVVETRRRFPRRHRP